ncbi:hypothetical protein GPX89_13135 [Nocardia sp. ET3-3]|uniref:Low temperature requirement protein A n=1 Tax=Nocardia terrae TaxID=2675851 RepID=A0A7K1UUY8_9NOCA|nr:low temperature requirement protein A [Nocardia terrae]MVU78186.1 hypothetical protein [Nocardia terrae]
MSTVLQQIRAYATTVAPAGPVATITGIEMFYDVMKAFTFSQVDTLILREPSAHGFLHGLLILAIVWGCWVSYCWAANTLRADVGVFRSVYFLALLSLTLLGLSLPLAFTGSGLQSRAVIFIVSYLMIRLGSAVLVLVARGPAHRRRAALVVTAAAGTATLIAVSAYCAPGAQNLLWVLALAVEIAATIVYCRGWQIHSAERFAERFGFLVTAGLEISLGRMAFGMLGEPVGPSQIILIATTTFMIIVLWWFYFDLLSRYAKHRLEHAHGPERIRIAVVVYSMLHLLVVAGMLLIALAMRTVGHEIYTTDAGLLGRPLEPVWAASLVAGFALYCVAIAAMWRGLGQPVRWSNLTGAAAALALLPVLRTIPAVLSLLTIGVLALAVALGQYAVGYRRRRELLAVVDTTAPALGPAVAT